MIVYETYAELKSNCMENETPQKQPISNTNYIYNKEDETKTYVNQITKILSDHMHNKTNTNFWLAQSLEILINCKVNEKALRGYIC